MLHEHPPFQLTHRRRPLPGFQDDRVAQFRKCLNLFALVEVADASVQTAIELQRVPIQELQFFVIPGSLLAEEAAALVIGHVVWVRKEEAKQSQDSWVRVRRWMRAQPG